VALAVCTITECKSTACATEVKSYSNNDVIMLGCYDVTVAVVAATTSAMAEYSTNRQRQRRKSCRKTSAVGACTILKAACIYMSIGVDVLD